MTWWALTDLTEKKKRVASRDALPPFGKNNDTLISYFHVLLRFIKLALRCTSSPAVVVNTCHAVAEISKRKWCRYFFWKEEVVTKIPNGRKKRKLPFFAFGLWTSLIHQAIFDSKCTRAVSGEKLSLCLHDISTFQARFFLSQNFPSSCMELRMTSRESFSWMSRVTRE